VILSVEFCIRFEMLHTSSVSLAFLIVILTVVHESVTQYTAEPGTNPCKLAKKRKLSKNVPAIRVIDETGDETPDIYLGLGRGALFSFMVHRSLQKDVVIECSSSLGEVEWEYRGRGVSKMNDNTKQESDLKIKIKYHFNYL
jgi:hypothetical protein